MCPQASSSDSLWVVSLRWSRTMVVHVHAVRFCETVRLFTVCLIQSPELTAVSGVLQQFWRALFAEKSCGLVCHTLRGLTCGDIVDCSAQRLLHCEADGGSAGILSKRFRHDLDGCGVGHSEAVCGV